MSFEYFHVGDEYEFSFYRLPKELIRDPAWKDITMEAKVLYSKQTHCFQLQLRTPGSLFPLNRSIHRMPLSQLQLRTPGFQYLSNRSRL